MPKGDFVAAYKGRPHSEIGVSLRDAWVSDGWLPRMPESLEDLDGLLLLAVPKNRTVQRDGIHFQGQRYLSPTLGPFVEQTVTIRYDAQDISEIRVYDHDTFVCVAIDEDHANPRLSLRDIDAARRARRKELTSREEPHITEPVWPAPAAHLRRGVRMNPTFIVTKDLGPYITEWGPRGDQDEKNHTLANRSPTVFYTPDVLCRPKTLMKDMHRYQVRIGSCIDEYLHKLDAAPRSMNRVTQLVALLIIDEVERLNATALEFLRDNHDQTHLPMILIGMPGIDQRFRHYPQL